MAAAVAQRIAYRQAQGAIVERAWHNKAGHFHVVRNKDRRPVELIACEDGRVYAYRLAKDDRVNEHSYVPGLFDFVVEGTRLF